MTAARAIDTEPEVAQYLLLCLLLGEDAPERLPWFRGPLADPALLRPLRNAAVDLGYGLL